MKRTAIALSLAAAAAAAEAARLASMPTATAPGNSHTVDGPAAGGGETSAGRPYPRSSTVHPRPRRQRQRAEGMHLSVPVAFGKYLAPEDSAFLLAEVRRCDACCISIHSDLCCTSAQLPNPGLRTSCALCAFPIHSYPTVHMRRRTDKTCNNNDSSSSRILYTAQHS